MSLPGNGWKRNFQGKEEALSYSQKASPHLSSFRAIKFVRCDMTKWADQLAMFKTALSSSQSGRVEIVVTNAGISGYDSVFFNDST
jgi:NAD(P)-dependent dehydrogenase (short-subunit alcohol dehydrogenase family)